MKRRHSVVGRSVIAIGAVVFLAAALAFSAELFSVTNALGGNVAYFDETGDLYLKKTITTNQTSPPIDTSNGGLVIKSGATVVAFIDTSSTDGGEMTIYGSLTENTTPIHSACNIFEVRDGATLVATICDDGDMDLAGEVFPNSI